MSISLSLALTVALVGFPFPVHAAPPPPGSEFRVVSTAEQSDGLQSVVFEDQQGHRYLFLLRTVPVQQGNSIEFWLQDLPADRSAAPASEAGKDEAASTAASGWKRLPKASWFTWNDGTGVLYISHDLAVDLKQGAQVSAVLFGLLTLVPYCQVAGPIFLAVMALTAARIDWLDSRGSPGFTIYYTASPPRVWFKP